MLKITRILNHLKQPNHRHNHAENGRMTVHPVLLSFTGDCLKYEKDFIEEFKTKGVVGLRRGLIMFMIIYLSFLLVDIFLIPDKLVYLIKLRTLGTFIPSLFLIGLTFLPVFKKHPTGISWVSAYYTAFMAIIVLYDMPPVVHYLYTAGLILIFFAIHVALYQRFISSSLLTFSLVIFFVFLAHFVIKMPATIIINFTLFLACSSLLGMVASYMTELYSRREYFDRHQLAVRNSEILVINTDLEGRIKTRTSELASINDQLAASRHAIIFGLAKIAESRDECTGGHLERIREYSIRIARRLSFFKKYKGYITDEYIADIYESSILHDIGKVGIPDSILLKPGRLDPAEFEVMKTHATIGGDALQSIDKMLKSQTFLSLGIQIAYYHHEKWDGTGYPKGLKEEDIPLSARIVALADVYDALRSERPYKTVWSHEQAREYIVTQKGKHFAPDVIDAFLETEETIIEISK